MTATNTKETRRACRNCGALLTDTAIPYWCSYCHALVEGDGIVTKARRAVAGAPAPDSVQPILSAAQPIHPLALEEKKKEYTGKLVIALTVAVCVIAASVNGFQTATALSKWAFGLLITGMVGIVASLAVFAAKLHQLNCRPISVSAQPPAPAPWREYKREVKRSPVSGLAVAGVLYVGGALITGILAFLGCYVYAIAAYGLLLGGAVGWIPALIIGFVVGLLWPVIALIIVVGVLVSAAAH